MNPRLRAMLIVGGIVSVLMLISLFVFINQQELILSMTVANEEQKVKIQLKLLQKQINQTYLSRIQSFATKKEDVMRAFATGDREKLLQLARPYFTIFSKENKYFKTLFFITADNKYFLRVHKPKLFGDDAVLVSPLVTYSNRFKKSMAGFEVVKMGLQYRIIHPVFVDNKYVGVVGFGIDSDWIRDALYENSSETIGIFFPDSKIKKIVFLNKSYKKIGSSALFCEKDSVLQLLPQDLDLNQNMQRLLLDGTSYALLKSGSLNDHNNNQVAGIVIVKSIEHLVSGSKRVIALTIIISLILLAATFSILYLSFGALFKKITNLNESLEQNNKNLEHIVEERTAELKQKIKEKTKAQLAATRAKEEWERTFDAVPDMISIMDEQYQIVRANKAMADGIGMPIEKLVHTKCYKSVHCMDEPPAYCPHQGLLEDHQPRTTEVFEERLQRHLAVTVSPLKDKEGKFFGSVHIVRDITAQKKAEGERIATEGKLQKAEKMEAIGLMAGGVAHDLNNILSGIVSYPELLLLKLSKDDELYEPIKSIQASGKRAAAVVADLLTVARGVATVKEFVSLNTLVEEYLESTEFRNLQSLYPNVDIQSELDDDIWIIQCSVVHIQKVLMNLITNAAEAVNFKGSILISTANQRIHQATALASSLEAGEYVVLTIKDTGSGIAKHDLEHIFEPFYSKKVMGRSGTGLGLAVVWNTMKDHGAFIRVDSDNNGTVFTLYFPSCRGEAIPIKVDTDLESLKGIGTVLVVDDDEQQRDIAARMLTMLGYTIATVSSGEDAIAYCRKTSVDLLLLDMLMEPGINGLETYRQIIEFSPVQKAIIASGFSESSSVLDAKVLGAGSFIKKPYSIEQLGKSVQKELSK